MNVRFVFPAVALLALSACGVLDPLPEPPVHAAKARLVLDPLLTRRRADAGILSVQRGIDTAADHCRHRIYLDGSAVADLRSNEVVHIYAAPGPHQLRVEPNGADCNGAAYEMAATSEQGTSQSFRTAATSGKLLMSAAD